VTLVLPSGKHTQSHTQAVAVSVQELWHTFHQRSGTTSIKNELSNMTSTASPFYSGN